MQVIKIMLSEGETVFPFELRQKAQKYLEEKIKDFSFVGSIIEIERVFGIEEEIAKENGNMICKHFGEDEPYELENPRNAINIYIL